MRDHRPGCARTAALLVAMIVAAGPGGAPAAHAHSYEHGEVTVGHIWAPPTAEDGTAVYGALLNRGDQTARLIGASSRIADTVRFRVVEDGRTSWPEAIAIAPGKVTALAPWRVHIWLSGLGHPLEEGESFPLTLTFERAGAIEVEVVVESEAGH